MLDPFTVAMALSIKQIVGFVARFFRRVLDPEHARVQLWLKHFEEARVDPRDRIELLKLVILLDASSSVTKALANRTVRVATEKMVAFLLAPLVRVLL